MNSSHSSSLHGADMAKWREYLRDAPAPAFPRRQNLSVTPIPGSLLRHKMQLPAEVSLEVSKALVQLAWCLVSVYYSDTDDVVVGVAVLDEDETNDGSDNNNNNPQWDGGDDRASSSSSAATAVPFRFTMDSSKTIQSCVDAILNHGLPRAAVSPSGITLQDIAKLGSDMANATLFENQLVIYAGSGLGACAEVQLDRTINVECTLTKSRATVQAFYDDTIIARAEMQGVLDTFDHLFTQLTNQAANLTSSSSTKTLGDITPISPKELTQVIEWNKDLPPAVQETKHRMIERMARQQPSAEAVCALDLSISYSELDDMADRLAYLLVAQGVQPGDIVPFMFEKSPWAIPTLIAINKAGGAFAPLDPAHPWTDTAGILETCSAKLVLCSPLHTARFESASFPHLVITPSLLFSTLPSPPPSSTSSFLPAVSPSSPAYIIFTSGSTGVPKGIICSHSAWTTHTVSHGPVEFHSAATRTLQFSAYTWDVSISDMFTTLATGGTVCIPTEHERLNDLPGAIARMGANHIVLTPTVAQFLRPETVPGLKTVVTIGEQMPQAFVESWTVRGVNLVNAYGPSETISRCCCAVKKPGDVAANIGTNCGAALWVAVSNDPGRLVPIGAVGELLVEGPILASGYLRNEKKTREVFIPVPGWLRAAFPGVRSEAEGKVVYRTGDLVRQLQDGSYLYVGRRDTQIKVHGVRLEAGHIEAKIRGELDKDADLVVDKILVGGGEARLRQMLAAFVTFPQFGLVDKSNGVKLLEVEERVREFVGRLHARLVESLPSYMVPNYILPLTMIPLGATGKVNRRGLQAFARGLEVERLGAFMGSRDGSGVEEGEKPKGEAESQMAALWAAVIDLPVGSIGRHDSFFGLGGDSVTAMKLVGEAARAGLRLSVADVFQHSVLAELALFVSEGVKEGGKGAVELEPIEAFELIGGPNQFRLLRDQLKREYHLPFNRIEDVYPATPMQEGLMAESISTPEAYILHEVHRLSRNVDLDRLEAALQVLVEAYPILRTRIVRLRDLGTCQVVMSEDSEAVELQAVNNTDLRSFLAQDKQAHMGFGDMLSRFAVVHHRSNGNRYLVWTAHHAITDGHINQDIVKRLELAYHGEKLAKTTDFKQLIKMQLDNKTAGSDIEYWRGRFSGFNSNNHYPPCGDETYEPSVTDTITYRASLPKEASRYTPSVLLRAAWAFVLAQANGDNQDDVVMGVTQSGRHVSLPGMDQCLGPCLVTIPVRVRINLNEECSEYLNKVQKDYIDAMPYQHTGLQHIRKASNECANAVGFRNLLVVQPAIAPNTSNLFLIDETTRTNADDQLNFGLFLECILSNNGEVEMRAGFDKNLLSAKQANLMMHRLEHIYSQLSKSSNANFPLSRLSLVSPLDVQTLELFNPNIEPFEQCMHWMIEEQAKRQPDALMVDSWDAQLTYQQANEYSERLAGVLVNLGIGPETIVPFAFEKSAWATIAIHAILKAGGACVALDMVHPKERHEKVIGDTMARIIVSSTNYSQNMRDLGIPHVVAIDRRILDNLPSRPAETRRVNVTPSNAAWVVYSSGSTGTPKGSILEHRSLCSTSRTNSQILGVGPHTRAIHFASYSFDVAIEENTIIPMYGGCVCIPSDEERLNDLPGAMRRLEVNWADLTPTVARMLSPNNVPCLKTLVLGGESLTQEIIDTWATNCDLFNTYGPSECSIQCTSSLKPLKSLAKGANIGSPVNCRLWVVDAEDPARLLPAGATGELLVEGPIVGRCYLNQPAKTREAFIESLPWADNSKRRFYRTGDLARFNSDGTLDCLGRRDSQIKLNGQRVELGEIEYNIKKYLSLLPPSLETVQVAVEAFTPSTSSINGRKLLAVFIQVGNSNISSQTEINITEMNTTEMTESLRLHLAQIKTQVSRHIPEYMVPAAWVPLVNLPMNTSGKIDRKKLSEQAGQWDRGTLAIYSLSEKAPETAQPAPAMTAPASMAAVPITPTAKTPEITLANLWADVLGIDLSKDPIRDSDSFLELGGDSIAAMHLVGKAKAAGLVGLSVPTLMKRPSFGEMAVAISSSDSSFYSRRTEKENVDPYEAATNPFYTDTPVPGKHKTAQFVEAQPKPAVSMNEEAVNDIPAVTDPEFTSTHSQYSPFQLVKNKVPAHDIMTILANNYKLGAEKVVDVYQATPLQEGLMALTSTDGNAYVLRDTYELPGDIDIVRFQEAWDTVVRQNSIFRTRIVFIPGLGTCQVVTNNEPVIEWQTAQDLGTYLTKDRNKPMNYGTKLARFAIVNNSETKKNTFVWTIHHALYDGFSMGLTFAAVDLAYSKDIAALHTRPFVDFISYLQSIDKEESDAFWTDQLKEIKAAQFPPVPDGYNCKADNTISYLVPLSADRASGITTATILRSAWSILVSRVSDSPDVVFGLTQFGRDVDLNEIENINGPTIATVPVRILVDPKASVKDFVKRVQAQAIDMIPFSHAGLQNIKKINDATRTACDFQNLLVIQPADWEEESALFKKHKTATTTNYLSGYGLAVECALGDGEVTFSAHHDSTVISEPQVQRLLHQFEHLVNQLHAHSVAGTSRIQDIDMFSPADRADLVAWNSNYPTVVNECVHDLISRNTAATPDAPAIASRAVNLNFKQLDEYTNHLAHELQSLGIGPEMMVPICLEKSPEAVISMIAIQKAGGAYVPLNPADPIDRIIDLIDQVSASVVIFSEQTKHLIPSLMTPGSPPKFHPLVHPPSLTHWPSPLNSNPIIAPSPSLTPSNLAYALFTSGSTGRPKAVLVSHRTLASSMHNHGRSLGFASASPRRILQFASYTFDASIAEIFTVLVFGGCVCIPTEHERMNDLVAFMNDMQVDYADFTPSFVKSLRPEQVKSLRTVVLGGEAMNRECIDVWGDCEGVTLMNGYGPTETCVVTVAGTVLGPEKTKRVFGERKGVAGKRGETWIGHPVSSIGWVVDPGDHNRLTPVGCVGELMIQGPNVAREYLGNEEKTREVFVRSADVKWLRAFGHVRNERLYKTGDLVVQDIVDGSLTYLGRKDNQTKVNGQRLELGEIETQLKAKGASLKVESAVVLAGKTKSEKSKQSLAAFIHFSDVKSTDTSAFMAKVDEKILARLRRLESAMRSTLPKYMVPSLWIPVSRMPTLASAKTDRKTLAALFQDLDGAQVTMYSLSSPDEQGGIKREASTDLEKTLTQLVAQTLGRKPDDIGTNDSFLRLGGDSITAIQLVAAARGAGVSLSTELILRHPRIYDMASAVAEGRGDQLAMSTEPILPFSLVPDNMADELLLELEQEYNLLPSEIADILPCTPLQEGLIALTIKYPDSYVLREVYRLPAKMNIAYLKAAWEIVVRDTNIMRTRMANLGDRGCFQVVLQHPIDGIAWTTATKVQEYIEHDKAQPFGYGVPLVRFGLVQTEYTGSYFILSMHHSVYDGWSRTLLMKHVSETYLALQRYKHPPTPLTISAPSFNRFISHLQSIPSSESQTFWAAQFSELDAQPYPRIPTSPDFSPELNRHHTITIPTPAALSQEYTLPTLLKAAYAVVLSRYTSSPDTLFGLVQSGRNVPVPGIEDMVGPTITTVPLRIRLDLEGQTVKSFLRQVQGQGMDMMRHEHTGLQNIARFGVDCRRAVEAVGKGCILVIQPGGGGAEGEKGRESMMGMQRVEDQADANADAGFLRYAMGLEVTLGSEEMEFTGGYDARLMSEGQMGRFLRQLRTVLGELGEALVEDGGEGTQKLVGEIDMVSGEDMAEMEEINSVVPDDVRECTHNVIHRTARERSGAMAVNAWDVDFTYIEVDTLSTKLARYLKEELGIGPEAIVPLCFEKSGWAVVAMLGVMKAGAAFVFLDPGYPMARLDDIVRQVNAKVILASLDQGPIWKGSDVPVLVVDNVSIESLPEALYEDILDTGVTPSNALYLIFTSGSTGNPKGCVVEHHSFLTCARAQAGRSHMTSASRVLQGASYSFDVSVMEMLTALTVGACICVPNERIKKRSIVDVINDLRITWAFLTPSIAKFIKPTDIPLLQTLILGGEALTKENIQTWAGHVRLINGYGPSECTIAASAHTVISPNENPANIGKALGGICWITDPNNHNKLAPMGTVGELVVEGSIVARGYLNNPKKTSEVFIENPDWARSTAHTTRRMYKTGDLAYFNTDGDIIFVGRKDAQVKIRGQRMELGEIETHLTLDKNIQHAIAAYPKAGPCKKQLVGIVSIAKLGATTNSNGEVVLLNAELTVRASVDVANITKRLSDLVPSYMLPEVWIVVESFPLLLSGKLNRKRVGQWLACMDKGTHQRICGMGESIRIQAPSTEVEKKVHAVWTDVLRLPGDEIGTTQEFSTLGGDSILAMLVVGKLKAQGFLVTMTDVANTKTISQLAARISRTTRSGSRNSIIQLIPPKIEEETTGELFDLSPIQQFYASFTLKNDYLSRQTNKRFNHTFCLTVKQPLSASTIKSALEAVVARHSMLRARFQADGKANCGWKQYISSDISGSLRFCSWEDVTLDKVQPVIEQARQGLDIENGPLVSVDLVTPNDTEQYLMIVAHHLVVDLVSWNIILGDLESYLCTGAFVSEQPTLFSAWVKHQHQHAITNFSPQKAFPLRSLPRPNFNYWDIGNHKINIVRDEAHQVITLSERDTTALLTTCNKIYDAEPMDILCSALSHSFSYVFRDRSTPTIFRYGHGRQQLTPTGPDPSGTVGWFTTFCPLHIPIRSSDKSTSVLQRTIEMRKKLPHNGLAYFASRYYHPAGQKTFSTSAHEDMEVMINYLGMADNQARNGASASDTTSTSSNNNNTSERLFDMSSAVEKGFGQEGQEVKELSLFSVTAEVRGGRLHVDCQWNKKMKRQDNIQRWFHEYENALRDVAYQARKTQRQGIAGVFSGATWDGQTLTVPGQGPVTVPNHLVKSVTAPSPEKLATVAVPARAESTFPMSTTSSTTSGGTTKRPNFAVPSDTQSQRHGDDRSMRLPSFSFSDYGDGPSFQVQMQTVGGEGWNFD